MFDLQRKHARQESVQVAVIGSGPAGTTAALTADRNGMKVAMIDEHPLDMDSMAQDVPIAATRRLTLDRIAANNSLSVTANQDETDEERARYDGTVYDHLT